VNQALSVGAAAYVLKRSSRSELLAAITKVVQGERYLTPALGEGVPEAFRRTRRGAGAGPSLTPRQREVLQFVAQGHSSKQVAGLLDISTRTVEFHRRRIMERLGLATTAELIGFAVRQGLASE
jgi:DNA-binding NarL/FixJ family response regulator